MVIILNVLNKVISILWFMGVFEREIKVSYVVGKWKVFGFFFFFVILDVLGRCIK